MTAQSGVPHNNRAGDFDTFALMKLTKQGISLEEIFRRLSKEGGMLGLSGDLPDWGLDLSAGAIQIDNGIWWASFFPGLAIVLLTIGLSFLGEGLNDIINPLLKKERS